MHVPSSALLRSLFFFLLKKKKKKNHVFSIAQKLLVQRTVTDRRSSHTRSNFSYTRRHHDIYRPPHNALDSYGSGLQGPVYFVAHGCTTPSTSTAPHIIEWTGPRSELRRGYVSRKMARDSSSSHWPTKQWISRAAASNNCPKFKHATIFADPFHALLSWVVLQIIELFSCRQRQLDQE